MLFGKGTVCPLAKYEIPDTDHRKPIEINAKEHHLSEDELFWLCAHCERSEIFSETEDGEEYLTLDKEASFRDYCIDCPVQSYIDAVQERAAEARMS